MNSKTPLIEDSFEFFQSTNNFCKVSNVGPNTLNFRPGTMSTTSTAFLLKISVDPEANVNTDFLVHKMEQYLLRFQYSHYNVLRIFLV